MIQGSTPVLPIRLKDRDLTDAQAVIVTLRKDGRNHNFDLSRLAVVRDGDDSIILLHLREAETLAIAPGRVGIQLRWKDAGGEKHTTKPQLLTQWEAYCKAVMA